MAEVEASRSGNTAKSYRQAAAHFCAVLADNDTPPTTTPVAALSTDWMVWLIQSLHPFAIATERLYITAIAGFFEHASAEGWADVNLPTLKRLRQRRARREAARLPPFPYEEIERVLATVAQTVLAGDDESEHLRILRDRALLLLLADTGLRVAEACSLARGHVDWNEAHARVLGKGSREAIVRFSDRSIRALRSYLNARASLDGAQSRPLTSLPLFARHDRGAGKRVLPLSTRAAENIVAQWVEAALGASARGSITPHTFRHYFVTVVLRATGGNIRLAQELARHRSITTTQRYTHLSDDELDRGYHDVFNEGEQRSKGAEEQTKAEG
jgi:site-specific recombinase XerD